MCAFLSVFTLLQIQAFYHSLYYLYPADIEMKFTAHLHCYALFMGLNKYNCSGKSVRQKVIQEESCGKYRSLTELRRSNFG